MADFHAADLWVAVVPETSQVGPAMEKAGKDAKENFGKGVKGIGKDLRDGLHHEFDQIREKAKGAGKATSEAFNSELVREARKTLGTELGNVIGDKLESTITNQLKKVAGDHWGEVIGHEISEGIGDTVGGWIGGTKKGIKDVKKSVSDLKNGDLRGVSTALDTINDRAKDVGVNIDGWTGPLKKVAGDPLTEVQNKTKDIRTQAHDFLDVFTALPGKIGTTATALGALVDGPLAMAVAAALTIDHALHIDSNTFDPGQHGWGHVLFGKTWDWFGGGDPNTGLDKHLKPPGAPSTSSPGVPTPSGTPFTPQTLLGGSGAPSSGPKSLNDLLFPGAGAPHPSVPSVAPAAPSGLAVPLMQKPDGSWTSPNPAWAHLINRESGGNPSIFNTTDSNAAAGDPSQGLFQFTKATWASHGGLKYGPNPGKATPQQQAEIAANLIRSNPSGSDWGAGLSGRENARELLGGIGASSVSFGSWYPGQWGKTGLPDSVSGSGGASSGGGDGGFRSVGRGGSSGGVGPIPTGASHDPLYVTATGPGGQSGGSSGSPFESQGQQLGQGLLGGIMQSLGLDGSVFGGKSPMDWGAVKLGGGLLNYGMGLLNRSGPMGAPGMSGGGGGSMLSGLAGLIPQPGAMVSAAAGPGGGSYGISQQTGGDTHIHQNQPITINNPTGDPYGWLRETQWYRNSTGMNPPGSSGRTNLSPLPPGS